MSRGWFDAAVDATIDQTVMPDLTVEIGFDVLDPTALTSRMLFSGGHLVSWQAARAHDPDVVIAVDAGSFRVLLGAPYEPGGCERAHVRTREGLRMSIPPTPEDLALLHPHRCVRAATLSLSASFYDHPFAPEAAYDYGFRDAMPTPPQTIARLDVPRVSLKAPFVAGVGYLLGQIPFREFSGRAEAGHDPFALAALTGLIAPPGLPPASRLEPVLLAAMVLTAIAQLRDAWPPTPTTALAEATR